MALRDEMCAEMENYIMNAPSDWNTIKAEELKKMLSEGAKPLLLDVREPEEFAAGHLPGALNIPVKQLPRRVKELPGEKKQPIVAYCASGIRSAYATMFLRVYGYEDVRSLVHGIREWIASGGQTG